MSDEGLLKPLLVGQAPARSMRRGAPAFIGTASWIRMCSLLGVTSEELQEKVDTDNLIQSFPGRSSSGKGDRFPRAVALRGAARVRADALLSGRDLIIACGALTARYLAGAGKPLDFYERTEIAPGVFLVPIPHPGGTSHYLNAPERRAEFAGYLHGLLDFEPRRKTP